MANRIIQESICSSESIDKLSHGAEIAFYRLIVCVDDYGRIDGRLPILKAKLYPLKTMPLDEIAGYMEELESAGLIWSYEVDGRTYYQMRTWDKYQRVRNKRSKCPAPLDSNPPRVAVNCQQSAAECGPNPYPYPDPYPNPNPKPECGECACARADQPTPAPLSPATTVSVPECLGDEITDEEMAQTRETQETADQLVRAYGLPRNSRTLDAIVTDIQAKGVEAVRAALDAATDADTKGGISLRFYRACLNGGHARKGRDAPGDMIRHTAEEWERSSAAAIVNLED